jgi:hypothetical protein
VDSAQNGADYHALVSVTAGRDEQYFKSLVSMPLHKFSFIFFIALNSILMRQLRECCLPCWAAAP